MDFMVAGMHLTEATKPQEVPFFWTRPHGPTPCPAVAQERVCRPDPVVLTRLPPPDPAVLPTSPALRQ